MGETGTLGFWGSSDDGCIGTPIPGHTGLQGDGFSGLGKNLEGDGGLGWRGIADDRYRLHYNDQ